MDADVACARCDDATAAHYWPKPDEPREPVKRAWLSGLGFAAEARCCSRCMCELDSAVRAGWPVTVRRGR